jgi:hypothetical protein
MLEEAATPTHGLGHGKGVKQPKALSMPKVLQEFEMSSDVQRFLKLSKASFNTCGAFDIQSYFRM